LKVQQTMVKLGERDIRAIKVGAVCVGVMAAAVLLSGWAEKWAAASKKLRASEAKLAAVRLSQARREGLMRIVPAFEIPQAEQQQKFLFRDKVNEQLKKCGIKAEPLKFLGSVGSGEGGRYKVIRLSCRSKKCQLGQILDFLVGLRENPYLVSVEQFRMKCDPKKRNEFGFEAVLSTFAKRGGGR